MVRVMPVRMTTSDPGSKNSSAVSGLVSLPGLPLKDEEPSGRLPQALSAPEMPHHRHGLPRQRSRSSWNTSQRRGGASVSLAAGTGCRPVCQAVRAAVPMAASWGSQLLHNAARSREAGRANGPRAGLGDRASARTAAGRPARRRPAPLHRPAMSRGSNTPPGPPTEWTQSARHIAPICS